MTVVIGDLLAPLIRRFGVNPSDVCGMRIRPDVVTLTMYDRDASGRVRIVRDGPATFDVIHRVCTVTDCPGPLDCVNHRGSE